MLGHAVPVRVAEPEAVVGERVPADFGEPSSQSVARVRFDPPQLAQPVVEAPTTSDAFRATAAVSVVGSSMSRANSRGPAGRSASPAARSSVLKYHVPHGRVPGCVGGGGQRLPPLLGAVSRSLWQA